MKLIYKVRLTVNLGEIETTCYAIIDTVDDGANDGTEKEILFESVGDYVKSRANLKATKPLEGLS